MLGSMFGRKQKSYFVEVEGARQATADRPAQGPAYRSALHSGFSFPPSKTLYDNWVESVAAFGSRPCLGHREGDEYKYLSYAEAGEQAAAVAGAMAWAGIKPHGRCAVFGANCPEWMITMQACNQQTVYCVPLYDTLGDNTVQYILDHSESSIVFASATKLHVLAASLPKTQHTVTHVVVWGDASGATAAAALQGIKGLGLPAFTFQEFVHIGREHPTPPVPPKPDDLCTIMYTSGTTGVPKGVRLTHHMVASEVAGFSYWLDKVGIPIDDGDVYLSFLPLAHIYDRVMEETWVKLGAAIGYWGGDARGLPGDIQACQPTIFASVPRIYDRFYAAVTQKIKGAGLLKRTLFNAAFALKLAALRLGYTHETASGRIDRLIFKPVSKQMLGARIRLCVSGGAPLAAHIEDFMRVTCCCIFFQGAGLTETCAATFVDHPNEPDHFQSVGPPGPAFWVRLKAIPELGYDPLASPPRGEVLVKGDPVFQGYHKDEEETRAALDAEGWLHTGDVGELTTTGSLRIIDRKKNIFKLSQGEFIAVEKIEGVLLQSPLVEQLWVHGNRFESCLVAVVVPNKDALLAWGRQQGAGGSFEDVCASDAGKARLLHEVQAIGKAGGLKGFELPKALHLECHPFSVESDLLTPTFKLKRPQLLKKYQDRVDEMYRQEIHKNAPAASPSGPAAPAH